MRKLRIGILYGGRSVEHAVSVNSARNIFEHIDRQRFEPYVFGIDQEGQWFYKPMVDKEISSGVPVKLALSAKQPCLHFGNTEVKLDVVFSLMHGTDGEDGSIQGLLQAMNIASVGSGVLGSALSMNKIITKHLLKQAGLPVGKFMSFHKTERESINFPSIVEAIGLPFMCKSASLGSSVGISKVKDEASFHNAVQDSFQYDDEILLESFIEGREIECAIMGNTPPLASLPGEIIIHEKHEFYTFDAKYVDPDAVKIDVPAQINNSTSEEIRTLSVKAFQVLRCLDYSRVDLFLSKDGKVYINEINTIPGFTNSSMFPMMWKERGISFTDLISKLIDTCMERHKGVDVVSRSFDSGLKY